MRIAAGAGRFGALALGAASLATLSGCFMDPSIAPRGDVAVTVSDGRVIVKTCDALDEVDHYTVQGVRRSFVDAYSATYADLQSDGVDLAAGFTYVAGDSIAGMRLLDSNDFEPDRADLILITVSGGSGVPPEHVLQEIPVPNGGFAPDEWGTPSGSVTTDPCAR